MRAPWLVAASAMFALLCLPLSIAAQDSWRPARLEVGSAPLTPTLAVSGGEVLLEVTVTASGAVGRIEVLRTTPPFTEAVIGAVRDWRFQPAERTAGPTPGGSSNASRESVESRVLVASIFRPPSLNTPTLGEPPRDVAPGSQEVAMPGQTMAPMFPPLAQFDGTVLAEVGVGADGRITDATVIRSAAGFDEAALDAVRQWTFRPARIAGRAESTYAYVVMAFRQPVTDPVRR